MRSGKFWVARINGDPWVWMAYRSRWYGYTLPDEGFTLSSSLSQLAKASWRYSMVWSYSHGYLRNFGFHASIVILGFGSHIHDNDTIL